MGVTFIGHSSFFLQVGGQNIVIDPNFARWLFVLKRLRQPGLQVRDLPPVIWFGHSCPLRPPTPGHRCRDCAENKRRRGVAPTIVVPHHVFDSVSDSFDTWWNWTGGTATVIAGTDRDPRALAAWGAR